MARLPRLFAPGCAQHIIQRGNNRQACFFDVADYAVYLDKLKEYADKFHVAIHAFVLMTNHVHLLVTPEDERGAPKMMQSLGRYYVRYINSTYQRSGTLWEGRYKSTLVDSELYLLIVYRYIEMNPVRAFMVHHPADYPWSSYQCNGLGKDIELIVPHSSYMELGSSALRRRASYIALFTDILADTVVENIRVSTNKGWALGGSRFISEIDGAVNRRAESLGYGGDRKSKIFRDKVKNQLL
jgi:putative transposase